MQYYMVEAIHLSVKYKMINILDNSSFFYRDQAIECSDKLAEIKRLQSIARRHGAEDHELQAARVLSRSSITSQPAICSMAAKTVVFTNILG